MADSPDRRFDEKQVALVLRTAAELQEREAPSAGAARGLTLGQLEQIAGEAGIDPVMVRRAVARLDERSDRHADSALLGGPTEIVVERTVEGEVAPASFETLLDAVRRTAGQLGETSTVGRLFGWKGRIDGAKSEVSVSSAAGRSVVRVRVELDELAVGHFMTKGTLLGVGGGLISGAAAAEALGPEGWLLGGLVAAAGYLWARVRYARGAREYRARATDVVEGLEGVIARVSTAGAGEVAPRPPLAALGATAPDVSPSDPPP